MEQRTRRDPLAEVGTVFQHVAKLFQEQPLVKQVCSTLNGLTAATVETSARKNKARVNLDARSSSRIVVSPRFQDSSFAAILPGDSIAEQVITSGFLNFLNLYNSALVLRLVLTWFPSVPEAIQQPLTTVCDPYLNLFRGIIPPLGGTLDLSPILAFVTLNFFTSAAAALPCEMDNGSRAHEAAASNSQPNPEVQHSAIQQSLGTWAQPASRFEHIWARRVQAQRQQANGGP
ncbi:hypothetical protein CEUSTIGMA_g5436.t1 [Chlamydomonas eustigma]|uniref:YGGT family protein n=1 Tax=Chlamydomonas eustigma TaxID=1157962 RepID=A0A250X4J0_9CHLO|nr:hypothetical protein CEUSTIGMA_g5436.t1 [Chlamydomonas eustigma]|eukprot:GAX77994.1 hypothetical protein CEUSTIGMA_g5436.t1 [Chlamydomonas eustigma]